MNFIIPLYRYPLSVAIMTTGFLAFLTLPSVWPYVFPNSQDAILVMAAAVATKMLTGDLQGRSRTASGLAVGAALLSASALALSDPFTLATSLLKTFKVWRAAGYSTPDSFRAVSSALSQLSSGQSLAYETSLVIGLPVPLFFVMWAISKVAPNASRRISTQGPWRARWMNRNEIYQLRHNEKGLPLGLVNGAMLRYRPNPRTGWRSGHHAAIAGTRAGKGVAVVIPAIIDHDGPVAVLDIKGENFAVTRRHRQSLGRHVAVLNPFSVVEPFKDRFNPMDYIRQDHLVRDIEVIAEGLVRPESGNGAHFAEMAKSMIAAVLEIIVQNHPIQERNLVTAMDLIFSSDFDKALSE